MGKRLRLSLVWIIVLYLVCLLFLDCPETLNQELKRCYFTLCFQLIIFYFIWTILLFKYKVDVLEPIVLVTFIHLLLFEFTPIICLFTNRISFFGTNVWGGCVKATYISTLGYLFLLVFYYSKEKYLIIKEDDCGFEVLHKKKCLKLNYAIWLFAFACSLILIKGYGLSFKYLITGGNAVLETATEAKSIYGFLSIFAYAMIPSFLYIYILSKNKFIKFVLYYLMFMSFYVRGFRFIMVAAIVAPFILNCLKNKKRPNMYVIIFILIGLSIFSGYMQFARASIRAGINSGITMSDVFNFENISDMLIENFEIFKTYYAIVETFPNEIFYTLGAEIFLYTAILFVPRFIWPGKPKPPIYSVISKAVNGSSRDAGTAFPYLGEYYFEFGIIGVVFFMSLFGCCMKKLKKCMTSSQIHLLILYSCIFPLILQLMIRGYTPTNFYMILSVSIPILITKKIDKRVRKRKGNLNL